ncbi:probable WRKY transcription factor 30 [Sorghum bicolor]|uniref:WRKY domain-containing protein n=1 Tax=Sorghum bicolor TaxID=4558 RepID=C5Z4F2_SORBI|nr:probable WRKY transcription factor 30 [Sorghum bicolor]EER87882.1 hypothetical protein SORBI_3010G045700 [Sorghum bicolor]|eukprot:XP_002436515.1 probable WRKY transcription factor 30 [Sorghum bicolor]
MQDGAGAEAAGSSMQALLALLADGEEQARQLGEMMADDPWSRAEHYRGAARRLQCTLGKAAAVARAIEAAAPGSSRGTDDRSDSPRSADESSGRTTTEVQERQSMFKRRKGLPRWTAKFRVPDASLDATPDDGFSWRKYGQKDILGAKFPRGYYRCTYRTAQACGATKQVQRSDTDLCVFDVTYQGEHTCHQKQRASATVAAAPAHGAGSQSPPPPPPLEQQQQQQDPSMMQLLRLGFKRVLKVETTPGLHDHGIGHRDSGPASAPAAPFSFPSASPFHLAGEATDNPAAAFSPPPASSYFPAPHPVAVDGSFYDYEASPVALMRGAEPSELGEVVTRAITTGPAAFDYSSLFHHQAELDDPHLPFPPFGGPPHGPYQ